MQQYGTRHFNVETEPSRKGKDIADFFIRYGSHHAGKKHIIREATYKVKQNKIFYICTPHRQTEKQVKSTRKCFGKYINRSREEKDI